MVQYEILLWQDFYYSPWDQSRVHVSGDPGSAFKSATVIIDPHRVAMIDVAIICIKRINQHELFTLPFDFVFHIGIARIEKTVAFGRDDI